MREKRVLGICVPSRPEHGHIVSHRIKEDLA
jgi:hypothetical protein